MALIGIACIFAGVILLLAAAMAGAVHLLMVGLADPDPYQPTVLTERGMRITKEQP